MLEILPEATRTATLATLINALTDYGLEAADSTLLAKGTADFENIIADPAAAISGRKVLTTALRSKFSEVSKLRVKMDRRAQATEPRQPTPWNPL